MEVYWSLLTCEVLRVRLIVLNVYSVVMAWFEI